MARLRGVGRAQEIFNENVRARIEVRYGSLPNISKKIEALAKESGVGKSTIQRIIDPQTYGSHRSSLVIVESLAKALRCETHELLIPDDR